MTSEKDGKRKREVLKKVIAYMTLGIDVSRLFADMVRGGARESPHGFSAVGR